MKATKYSRVTVPTHRWEAVRATSAAAQTQALSGSEAVQRPISAQAIKARAAPQSGGVKRGRADWRAMRARAARSIEWIVAEASGAVLLVVALVLLLIGSAFAAEMQPQPEASMLENGTGFRELVPTDAQRAEPAPTSAVGRLDADSGSAVSSVEPAGSNADSPPRTHEQTPVWAASVGKPAAAKRARAVSAIPVLSTAVLPRPPPASTLAATDRPQSAVSAVPEVFPSGQVEPPPQIEQESSGAAASFGQPTSSVYGIAWSVGALMASMVALVLAALGTVIAVIAYRRPVMTTGRGEVRLVAPVPAARQDISGPPNSLHGREAVGSHAYVLPADLMAALRRQYPFFVRTLPANGYALTSIAGARHDNEDYALAFGLSTGPGSSGSATTLQCLVIADGCGGHPGGRDASHLAVRNAAESIVRDRLLPPEQMVANAFVAAGAGLARIGRYWGPNDLRSTLILVVATRANYYIGWIGDGGCLVHRADETWMHLMVPHRGAAQNLLAASLGPKQEGAPSFAVERRLPGDRLYAGSDGVLDMVNPAEFFEWFEERCVAGDDLQASLGLLLDSCAKDGRFDDNLTVAVLMTPVGVTAADPGPIHARLANAGRHIRA